MHHMFWKFWVGPFHPAWKDFKHTCQEAEGFLYTVVQMTIENARLVPQPEHWLAESMLSDIGQPVGTLSP